MDNSYHPVERSDQLQAITNYLMTGKKDQRVPYYKGRGTFDVTFEDPPTFYYRKSNGARVEVVFVLPDNTAWMNRLAFPLFVGGSRRHLKRSTRSKKSRRATRHRLRHRK